MSNIDKPGMCCVIIIITPSNNKKKKYEYDELNVCKINAPVIDMGDSMNHSSAVEAFKCFIYRYYFCQFYFQTSWLINTLTLSLL